MRCALEHVVRLARDRGAYEMHVVHLLAEAVRGEQEGAGHVMQLRAPAAGQKRDDQLAGGQLELGARLVLLRRQGDHVGERMPDIGDRHPGFLVERLLERKHDQDMGDAARDLAYAPSAPGPHRRADVVDRRDPRLLQASLEPEIEVRGVHADEQVRALGQQGLSQAPPDAHDLAVVPQHFGVAAHRELLYRIVRLEAQRQHLRPANPREHHRPPPTFEGGDKMRGKQISRGFAGHHADAR